MAAMMFPAISPMVLLYDRLIKSNKGSVSSNDTKQIEKERKTSVIVNKKRTRWSKEIIVFNIFFPIILIIFSKDGTICCLISCCMGYNRYCDFDRMVYPNELFLYGIFYKHQGATRYGIWSLANYIRTIPIQSTKNQMSWILWVTDKLLYEKME